MMERAGGLPSNVIELCPCAVDLSGHRKTWPFKILYASHRKFVRYIKKYLVYRANTIDYFLYIAYNINSKLKGGIGMVVTATDFKVNFGKYLALLASEDIFITKNGKTIAKVSNPNISAVDAISGILAGKLPLDYDAKALREERLGKYASDD